MEELGKDEIRSVEPSLLQGLLAAGDDAHAETVNINIQRNGKQYFSFHIRPLTEEEYLKASEKATSFERNKQLGIKIPTERNDALYRSILIHTATVDEDRKVLWDNEEARKHFDVLSGLDVIDKVLLPGEKLAVTNKIDEVSGYGTDLEETAKK